MIDLESSRIHLCDACCKSDQFPDCVTPGNVIEYGDANGLDNVIKCDDYDDGYFLIG